VASDRRDARSSERDRAPAAAGGRRRSTLFDVPSPDEPKGPNGGSLVN
jgi:hypothetical protein